MLELLGFVDKIAGVCKLSRSGSGLALHEPPVPEEITQQSAPLQLGTFPSLVSRQEVATYLESALAHAKAVPRDLGSRTRSRR